ncbi:cobalamin biosynthesis protein CbiG [Acidianus ambivalens]|uniref:Cobalamin biosynthesis protein CbiG n=1 Tax=Acidianus ambivalens TaxID=2283 RepID=A0A650CWQ0_ACIAM|nr:cobalamin biosynthesis protein CbiG [Acidianus ambivalens]MQL54465.1 cobalamin biosynthesis protein CbiG [Acidianus ambivalens]QGR22281.1 cobalamin biosynthesis protein CbiG [Acidianus ambivalens]
MYVSRIKIIAESSNELAKKVRNSLDELGYFIVDTHEEVQVYFYPIEEIIYSVKKFSTKTPVIIGVTDDGSYVIPLFKEKCGGSFIAGMIADLLGSQLILTSRTSQQGVYSIQEFAWINGLEIINREKIDELEKKLLNSGKLKVYSNIDIHTVEGYELTRKEEDADIVIKTDTEEEDKEINSKKIIMKPLSLVIALSYSKDTPKEAIYYSIISTLKSINILRNTVNFIITSESKNGDKKIQDIAKSFNSTVIYVKEKQPCEPSLDFVNARVILKKTRRAYGVLTCLGVK